MESNINQNESNIYAAKNAIEYLTEIGIYDLRDLGEERFKTLIEVITSNYHDKFIELEQIDVDTPPW